ncbi:hypothetical protein ANO14919_097270 [Xylariales sp. No.14919]|nr:hypothetical protein ANO14919_097270 [Xylariales sp. No.14919]
MHWSVVRYEILGERPGSTIEQHGNIEPNDENMTDFLDFLNLPLSDLSHMPYEEHQGKDSPFSSPQPAPEDYMTYLHPNPFGEVSSAEVRENKRPATGVSRLDSPKKRKTKCLVRFPPELMSMVIERLLEAKHVCAFDLVVPDWNICRGETPELERLRTATQIVTYTRGIGICQAGSLSCKFHCGGEDDIFAPTVQFNKNAAVINKIFSLEYMTTFCRSHTHVFTLGINDIPGKAVEELLQNSWWDLMPLRGQRLRMILPFDDEPNDIVKMRIDVGLPPIYGDLRHIAVHSPLELMKTNACRMGEVGDIENRDRMKEAFNKALDLDRSAHLWLSWSRMPNLESVFLDLRFYSHDSNTERRSFSKTQIIQRAVEMGHHLQLRILVLAGLQSYSFYTRFDGMTVCHVEEQDTINGEPNWIKIFRPAIREGGKLVLVDKLTDEVCLIF